MNEKSKKAVYASIWTLFMALACYLIITIMPTLPTNTLSVESYTLIAIEATLLIISLLILTVALKLRKQIISEVNIQPIKLTKIKKALTATLLTMLLATTTYAAIIHLASITSPPVTVERIDGYFQFSLDNATWQDAQDYFRVTGMSWYVRFNITSTFKGTVNVTWTLQYYDGENWVDTNVTVSSLNVQLQGTGNQLIYASPSGDNVGNKNWADETGVWRSDLINYEVFKIRVDFTRETP